MGLGFRFAINYSQKENTFPAQGVLQKKSGASSVAKKDIQVRKQENICKDKGNADWRQAAELPH